METKELEKQFNVVSEVYDAQRRELIPCFDDFYQVPLVVSENVQNVKHILDLGAGTGLMSAFFNTKYPEASYTLVDISESMLNKARERFSKFSNFLFLQEDFSALHFPQEHFDLVISSLAIHHLDDELKQLLFGKVYHFLKKGGWFINADQVLGNDTLSEMIYTTYWKNYVLSNRKLSVEAKEATFERIKLDKMATLPQQLNWLKQKGFQSPNCYYQYYNFVVFGAKK